MRGLLVFKVRYCLFLCAAHSVLGLTTLHVSLATDNNPGDVGDNGDLRYCLNAMNDLLSSTPDDIAVVFDFPMTIQLNGILPIINNSSNSVNITIGNPGSTPTVTIDGNTGSYPGFFIAMGNVTIQNMIFQNCTAQGGTGGNGISGGGGGMGAGGAIYVPTTFLNGTGPLVVLINVSINNCSAVGGNGGSYLDSLIGNEGGGGGGGFWGNGGSVTTTGSTGGGGGGGFGGDGGDVTLSADDPLGGGGGGGGGIGSRANTGTPVNLGNGGSDSNNGDDGNAYGLTIPAGSGGGGYSGGARAGGGGGGNNTGGSSSGGGGGGSRGADGFPPQGNIPPGASATPSGGNGGDGGGGGGGGVVATTSTNFIDGQAGSGGYGGGGGGSAGIGAYDSAYTVRGGSGGVGGGGGGGGVNQSGNTFADGGDSAGGGGGGGGGPSTGLNAPGGSDTGSLGGGAGGQGADTNSGVGGGGGGGGSGLGGAIFVDSGLSFTIQAFSGTPTTFNTSNTTTQAGLGGSGSSDAANGTAGSVLGDSIFLRSSSSLTFIALDTDDLLTLGEQVSFVDDTSFGVGGTSVFVNGNGTVIYNGTTDYAGSITINNANFKVNGTINTAPVSVCRNLGFSIQRGTLSGMGILTGDVLANSGAIFPDAGETLTLGSLFLNPAGMDANTLGSLVHIDIVSNTTSLVSVTRGATLAGTLEIQFDANAVPGTYVILTSNGITGTFDNVNIISSGPTPEYTISYLPEGSPTYVQFSFTNVPSVEPASGFQGVQRKNNFGFEYELYNHLTWTLSPSSETAGYFLYRDDVKIATLSATTRSYDDHDQPRGVSEEYSLVAFDSDGNTSSAVTVTVP